jgi:hypothetical protein
VAQLFSLGAIAMRILLTLSLVIVLAGCGRQSTQTPNPMFDTLLQTSVDELKLKTAAQTAWGFGKFDSWNLDQDVGNLIFSNKDGTTAVCPAQIIGTYDSTDKTWLWAWDNPSIADRLKTDSLKMKAYGVTNHIERLTTAEWKCEESDAWAMAALAVKLCGSQAAYRGPAGSTYVFITFGAVKLSKSP